MKRSHLTVAFALALASLLPAKASAGSIFHFSGKEADGYFSALDSTGCINIFAYIQALNGKVQTPPGPGTRGVSVFVILSQYNYCTGVDLVEASGYSELSTSNFSVGGNLGSASLTTTIDVFDYISNTSYPISINLSWTATTPAQRSSYSNHFHAPKFNVDVHLNGTIRFADSSGSISD